MTVAVEQSAYQRFLDSKRAEFVGTGIDVPRDAVNPQLFDFLRDLVRWALRKGRAAIFSNTGTGKTAMQLEWSRLTEQRTLILAPLAVARQTVREGQKFGVEVTYARSQTQASDGITITNYEMLAHFNPDAFEAVVLDESSILKSFEGKVRTALIEAFAATPLRLCCTATPAPNDIAELANHAEFLGIMTRTEMLATFFVHDDKGWRLKKHAQQPFYRWLASWGMSVKRPSDLGYSDEGYILPPLDIRCELVRCDWTPDGQLFSTGLSGITERSSVRKATVADRVAAAARLINDDWASEPVIAWAGLNEEGRQLAAQISDSVLIEGAQAPDDKADRIESFIRGDRRVMVTKSSITGFGLNLQNCSKMAFVGISDSYEQYFQSIRRCWRFGQTRPVIAVIVLSEPEAPIYHNVLRKEQEAERMSAELVKHVQEYERESLGLARQRLPYEPVQVIERPAWLRPT